MDIRPRGLYDRLRTIWSGPPGTGAGSAVFYMGGGASGTRMAQGWDFQRVANSVLGNPTGYACVRALKYNFSRPAWMILPADSEWPDQSASSSALKKHPLLAVLNRPNPWMSGTLMQQTIMTDLCGSGKSFWLKMQGRDGFGVAGPVSGLRRLPAQRVTVVGNMDDELLGFVYTDRAGRQMPVLPESVLYLRHPHPDRIYDGMAPALVAGLPAETDTASARFNRDLLNNDAALPGYLILKGVTPGQFADFKNEWQAGGQPGKTRFLTAEQADYHKVGQTNQELTYGELRQDSQDDIMRAFGVPRAVAMDVSHETYANAEREQAIFMQHNVLPQWVMVADEMTIQLGAGDTGDPARIAFNLAGIDELQDSRDAVVERGTKLMSYKAMTINEYRRSQGLPDVAWGDEPQAPLQPMSAVPLVPGATTTPAPAPAPAALEQPTHQPAPVAPNGH